ncbi:MAG: alanine racemase [Desulfobacterales bacterium]|jgi:alanine racemase
MVPLKDPDLWCEVDLPAIAANVGALRRITDKRALVMAVVKADGYGHGAVESANIALANGAERLAVARAHEGAALREAGIDAPILVLSPTGPSITHHLWKYRLTQSVTSLESASRLSASARRHGESILIHVKIDTGMGRLGLLPDCVPPGRGPGPVQEILDIDRLRHIEVEGIYTHFADADSRDKSFSRLQFDLFMGLLDHLRRQGFEPPMRHAANSAATIDMPETHLDAVRPGIAVYGLYPSADVDRNRISLTPAMTLKSRIIHIKAVPAGFPVSYGMTHETEASTQIATVPVGYADGLQRRLSNRGWMLVRGKRAPVAGRVCMDLTMIDVGGIPGAQVGDEVVILGRQGLASMTADEMAALLGTINYEVVFTNRSRVPRVYRR